VAGIVRDQGALGLHPAWQAHDAPVLGPDPGIDARGELRWQAADVLLAQAVRGEVGGGRRFVPGVGRGPEFHGVGPLRTKARTMGVGVLDDEAADPMRRAHGQPQADGRTEVVEVDEAFADLQPLEQFLDAVAERRERRPIQHVRSAEAGQVGRHHIGQP
jgi:hypothetical protein